MSRKRDKIRNEWNWHHRKPKKLGGSGNLSSPNMIEVPVTKHRAWHYLFDIKTPEEIANTINQTWLDPDWKLIAVRKEKK